MIDPNVTKERLSLKKAKQYYLMTEDEFHKEEVMKQLFGSMQMESAIVYCNSLDTVKRLTSVLRDSGIHVINLVY